MLDVRLQAHGHVRPAATVIVRSLETFGISFPAFFADTQHCGAVFEHLEFENYENLVRVFFGFLPVFRIDCEFDQLVRHHFFDSDREITPLIPVPGDDLSYFQVTATAVREITGQAVA